MYKTHPNLLVNCFRRTNVTTFVVFARNFPRFTSSYEPTSEFNVGRKFHTTESRLLLGQISKDFLIGTKGKTLLRWQNKDNLPDHYKLVYASSFSSYIKLLHAAMVGLPVFFVALKIYSLIDGEETNKNAVFDAIFEKPWQYNLAFGLSMMFTICAILASKRITRRMYYSDKLKEFRILCGGWLPFTIRQITCKERQGVQLTDSENIYHMLTGNATVNGEKLTILEHFFSFPVYYNKFFSYEQTED